jgi:hypothetical protein
MNFGKALRQCREARHWSRFKLEVMIRDAFRTEGETLSEQGIKGIELGWWNSVQQSSIDKCLRVLPELQGKFSTNQH